MSIVRFYGGSSTYIKGIFLLCFLSDKHKNLRMATMKIQKKEEDSGEGAVNFFLLPELSFFGFLLSKEDLPA